MTQNTQAPILSTDRDPAIGRLKTSSASRQELQIVRGEFYVGSSERAAVPIGDTYYSVLKAAPGKVLVIEDAIIEIDFSSVTDGQYSVALLGYVDVSNGNTWAYTPNAPTPIGRPLNAVKVNALPTSTVDLGVTVTGFTGSADYPFFFADYFIATQGNQSSVTDTGADFFGKGRQVILGPEQALLVRTTTAGDATGPATIRTVFFTSEIDIADVPSKLGATLEQLGLV